MKICSNNAVSTPNRQRRALTLATALLPLTGSRAVFAQAYPSRQISVIVPYSAGAGVDPVARLVSQKLAERLGQPVLVTNKTGAAGMIGAGFVAEAKPDGYTMLISASNDVAINQHLYKNIRYKAEKDFAPITQLVQLPMVLVVHPSVAAKTVQELVGLARSNPGKVTYSSPANGSLQHLCGARLQSLTGVKMQHIPNANLIVDLLAGRVDSAFLGAHNVATYVRDGRLKALGITSQKRSPVFQEVATMAEQGLPGLDMIQWFGAYLPAGAPESIVRQLNQALVAIVNAPDVRDQLRSQGAEPVGSSPEAFAQFLKSEIERFGEIVKISGATVDQ
jgi:tripartite-type tricarboxylate transporter receptor subunit TctC